MDELRDHLLPRTRLARDEHGGVARGDPLDELRETEELGAVAHERARDVRRGEAALEESRTAAERLPLERPLDAHLELVERARLGDVVEGPRPHRLDRRVDRPVARQHDDVGARARRLDGVQYLEPVPVGQAQVEEHDRGLALGHASQRLLSRARGSDVVAQPPQLPGQHLSEGVVVVDQEERDRDLHGANPFSTELAAAGSRISNVDPAPGSLSTAISPPQRRTKLWDRKRPRPVPPFRRLTNGSKIRFRCSGGMPHPSSVTRRPKRVAALGAQRHRAARPAGLHRVQHQVDEGVLQLRLVGTGVQARRERPHVDPDTEVACGRLDQPGHRTRRRVRGPRCRRRSVRATSAGSAG